MMVETWDVAVFHHQPVTTGGTDLQINMQDTDLQINMQDSDLQINTQDTDLQINMQDTDLQIDMQGADLQALIGTTHTNLGLRPLEGRMNHLAAKISSFIPPLQVIKLTP